MSWSILYSFIGLGRLLKFIYKRKLCTWTGFLLRTWNASALIDKNLRNFFVSIFSSSSACFTYNKMKRNEMKSRYKTRCITHDKSCAQIQSKGISSENIRCYLEANSQGIYRCFYQALFSFISTNRNLQKVSSPDKNVGEMVTQLSQRNLATMHDNAYT